LYHSPACVGAKICGARLPPRQVSRSTWCGASHRGGAREPLPFSLSFFFLCWLPWCGLFEYYVTAAQKPWAAVRARSPARPRPRRGSCYPVLAQLAPTSVLDGLLFALCMSMVVENGPRRVRITFFFSLAFFSFQASFHTPTVLPRWCDVGDPQSEARFLKVAPPSHNESRTGRGSTAEPSRHACGSLRAKKLRWKKKECRRLECKQTDHDRAWGKLRKVGRQRRRKQAARCGSA